MNAEAVTQLNLDVSIYPQAHISDFIGDEWHSVIDAVRQLSTGLIKRCYFFGQLETGKSHLLESVCTLYRDMGKEAIYLPMQALYTEPTPDSVLSNIENYDLIAIDDVHCISQSVAWQEAVFHLINRSIDGQCQLAFTSSKPVHELTFELADLVSRIAQSASFALPKIQPVDERKQMLKHILARRNLTFNESVMRHLVEKGPTKTSLMIAVVDELQTLSPAISKQKIKREVREEAEAIIAKFFDKDKASKVS